MMPTNIYSLRFIVGLLLSLLALVGACFFYWQSLVYKFAPVRVPIPQSELSSVDDRTASWPVPKWLCPKRWNRTGVRVFEAGKPLPLRVENEDSVRALGQGRFSIQGQSLCFSSPEQTNPLAKGRSYEFEVQRPIYHNSILAGLFSALAAGFFIVGFPWRHLQNLTAVLSAQPAKSAPLCLAGATILLILAAWMCLRTQPFLSLTRLLPLPPEAVLQTPEGHFCYYLPRWIRIDPFRVAALGFFENHQALEQVSPRDFNHNLRPGSYLAEGDYLYFQTSDRSPPTVNGRSYQLHALLAPPRQGSWWGLVLGSIGLFWIHHTASRTHTQSLRPVFQAAAWWAPILMASFYKLWVVAGDDPIGQNADGWVYAETARKMVWGEANGLPSHPSGFPFIAGLVAQFGLPWRLALECFYLVVCYLLARAVRILAGSRLAGLLLFTLMAWHPWTFSGFRDFMADPFLLVILGTLLAACFHLLSQPLTEWKWPPFLALGGLLFLWKWTRHEEPLLYASYGFFILLAFLGARIQLPNAKLPWRRLAAMLLLPLLITLAFGSMVKGIMFQRTGIYAKSLIDSPGLVALMKALYRVKPEQALRFAPVTRQSLRAACEASPTLKRFEKELLDPNAVATAIGADTTKIPGEFGPCLVWLVPQTIGQNAQTANQIMLKAAAEVHQALQAGLLPKRNASYPLDPNWRLWLPQLPRSFFTWFRHGTFISPAGEPWGTYHQPILQHTFDQAANRRTANEHPRLFLAQGALQAAPGTIDSVAITDLQGRWRGASLAYPSNFWEQGQAFDIRFPLEENSEAYNLMFLQQGKPRHTLKFRLTPLDPQKPSMLSQQFSQRESNIVLPETGQTISYDFRAGIAESTKKAQREIWENLFQTQYKPVLHLVLLLVFLLGFFTAPSQGPQLWPGLLCLLLLAGWFTLRAAFYGLVDANMGFQAVRYMRCVSPLFILILFLIAVLAGAFLQKQKTIRLKTPELSASRIES